MRRLPPVVAVLAVALALITGLPRPSVLAQGGALQSYFLVAAVGVNATVVSGCRPVRLYTAEVISVASHNVFLKLYNQCSAPAATDTPVRVLGAFAGLQTTGLSLAHALFNPAEAMRFSTGLSYRVTTGLANTNAAGVETASTVIVQFTYAAG